MSSQKSSRSLSHLLMSCCMCMLPMVMARSSSGMVTKSQGEEVVLGFSPRWQCGRSMIYDCLVAVATCTYNRLNCAFVRLGNVGFCSSNTIVTDAAQWRVSTRHFVTVVLSWQCVCWEKACNRMSGLATVLACIIVLMVLLCLLVSVL